MLKQLIMEVLSKLWPFGSSSDEERSDEADRLISNYPSFFTGSMDRDEVHKTVKNLHSEE